MEMKERGRVEEKKRAEEALQLGVTSPSCLRRENVLRKVLLCSTTSSPLKHHGDDDVCLVILSIKLVGDCVDPGILPGVMSAIVLEILMSGFQRLFSVEADGE